eukprot:g721.t1
MVPTLLCTLLSLTLDLPFLVVFAHIVPCRPAHTSHHGNTKPGVGPSQTFAVSLPGDRQVHVTCPEGKHTGDSLLISVPAQKDPIPCKEGAKKSGTKEGGGEEEEDLSTGTGTATAPNETKSARPRAFTEEKSINLKDLRNKGDTKAWFEGAMELLTTAVNEENLSRHIEKDGPKLLSLGLDLLAETNPNPIQTRILSKLRKLCDIWQIDTHESNLPEILLRYVEPSKSPALRSSKEACLELHGRIESVRLKSTTDDATIEALRKETKAKVGELERALPREIWRQLTSALPTSNETVSTGRLGFGTKASILHLAEIMVVTNARYHSVYDSIVDGLRADDPSAFDAMKRIANEIANECRKRGRVPKQTTTDIFELLVAAKRIKSRFDSWLKDISSNVLKSFASIGPLKKFYRMVEKSALRQENVRVDADPRHVDDARSPPFRVAYNYERVCDVRRAFIQVTRVADIGLTLELIRRSQPEIVVVRVKNRFSNPSCGGWADVMVNFYFACDPSKHVCEVQIVHDHLMVARANLGGHSIYGKGRAAAELLEIAVKIAPTAEHRDLIALSTLKSYCVSHESILSEEFSKAGGWSSWGATADLRLWKGVVFTRKSRGAEYVGWFDRPCDECATPSSTSGAQKFCVRCHRSLCSKCASKGGALTKHSTTSEYTCAGRSCEGKENRVDMLATALNVLRDFDAKAVQSCGAFDGLRVPSLEALDLGASFLRDRVTDGYVKSVLNGLRACDLSTRIRALRLRYCTRLTDEVLANVTQHVCGGLAYIDVRGCPLISQDAVERIQIRISSLERIEYDGNAKRLRNALAMHALGNRSGASVVTGNLTRDMKASAHEAAKTMHQTVGGLFGSFVGRRSGA